MSISALQFASWRPSVSRCALVWISCDCCFCLWALKWPVHFKKMTNKGAETFVERESAVELKVYEPGELCIMGKSGIGKSSVM